MDASREKRKTGRAKTPAGNTFNGARFYSVGAQASQASQAASAAPAAPAAQDTAAPPDTPRREQQE